MYPFLSLSRLGGIGTILLLVLLVTIGQGDNASEDEDIIVIINESADTILLLGHWLGFRGLLLVVREREAGKGHISLHHCLSCEGLGMLLLHGSKTWLRGGEAHISII